MTARRLIAAVIVGATALALLSLTAWAMFASWLVLPVLAGGVFAAVVLPWALVEVLDWWADRG